MRDEVQYQRNQTTRGEKITRLSKHNSFKAVIRTLKLVNQFHNMRDEAQYQRNQTTRGEKITRLSKHNSFKAVIRTLKLVNQFHNMRSSDSMTWSGVLLNSYLICFFI